MAVRRGSLCLQVAAHLQSALGGSPGVLCAPTAAALAPRHALGHSEHATARQLHEEDGLLRSETTPRTQLRAGATTRQSQGGASKNAFAQ